MLNFDLNKMLYVLPADKHSKEDVTKALNEHPEVKFVSFVGIDMSGNDTDEKIPVSVFLEDFDKLMSTGVQTDGSSVVLPKIAKLNNARVDIIPDKDVNWYVDHNLIHIDYETELPIGTLRIPAFLLHNDNTDVGSRVILKKATKTFESKLLELIKQYPTILKNTTIENADDIENLILTSATELEFWVKTPEDSADREKLSTAQILKEQYWKRTVGPVRKALEKTLMILDKYGIEMEMGHKEVGGVKGAMTKKGEYDHIMEQLEIDWKYSTALQAADNENMVKYVVRDVFRVHGLDVTFEAKPMTGIAGSGEHTHLGVAAKLKNGKVVNLFSPKNMHDDFLSPIGFGALMGLMKNYEVVNPFVAPNNDAFNRLKPGYEAPVCVVTSLGHAPDLPSRNRTVMIGLIRDINSPAATRFELRGPCPTANTYLIIAAAYMTMLDGIKAVAENDKNSAELEKSISKAIGEEDFYLEKERMYRSENNIYDTYTIEEMDKNFGKTPRTVWQNLTAFNNCNDKAQALMVENVMTELDIVSFKKAMLDKWITELHNRVIPNNMDRLRKMTKVKDRTFNDYDAQMWEEIMQLKLELGKNELGKDCLMKKIIVALDSEQYELASDLQIEMNEKMEKLNQLYLMYKRNLFVD